MKLGVPWSVKGIRPEARETAREAARRAGMPLSDWLNSVIIHSASEQGVDLEAMAAPEAESEDVATVHAKLDDLTRRIDRLTRGPEAYAPPHVRSDLDHRASFNQRLESYAPQAHAPSVVPTPEMPAAAKLYTPPPYAPPPTAAPAWSLGLNNAVAEIAARRRALSETAPRPSPPVVQAPPVAPPAMPMPAAVTRAPLPAQDLSGLEEQLRQITDRIDTLRTPGVEEAINALRNELAEIGHSLNDAMPRRAIETIERQIQSLTQRIAEGRQAGVDGNALANIEHGLAEVRDALYQLTPAESLIGFNDAINGLAQKIDLIVAERDPGSLAQLENAINTLRQLATHVASNEAVSSVASDVAMLAEKIDRIAQVSAGGDALAGLEERIAALADALAARSQNGGTVPARLETLVNSLSDKIEQLQSSRGDSIAFGHLEDRIVKLVEKLDASDSRLAHLEAVERGLGDLLVQMSELRAQKNENNGLHNGSSGVVDALKGDLTRTQNEIEAVHGTLGQLVDRLTAIEQTILGEGRAAPAPAMPGKLAVRVVPDEPPPAPQQPAEAPLELPATAIVPAPQPAQAQPQPPLTAGASLMPPEPPRRPVMRGKSAPINPDLPPDLPLEPGSGAPRFHADAAARIAASEAALGNAMPVGEPAPESKSSFIAAARRAAQAAMRDKAQRPPLRATPERPLELPEAGEGSIGKRLSKRIKSLFVASSVIAIVIGGMQIGSKYFDASVPGEVGGRQPQQAARAPAPPDAQAGTEIATAGTASDAPPSPTLPGILPPSPQLGFPAPNGAPAIPSLSGVGIQSTPAIGIETPSLPPSGDITGSVSRPSTHASNAPGPAAATQANLADEIPIAIGSPILRKAAANGDAGAAYEIAVRYAEGRGVPANLTEAARWFERAARKGLAPAQFRLGSLYEKGQGVKKDIEKARQNYLAAAAQGNAKAMHNLAVLYAEGIGGKPDFKNAAQWFQSAAERGIADSQYNLAVLYARGLGADKSMTESYKWFALAAAQGDKEAARKRDEVAAHLQASELAAERSAVESWTPKQQPSAATTVPQPAGGWDAAGSTAPRKPKGPLSITLGSR